MADDANVHRGAGGLSGQQAELLREMLGEDGEQHSASLDLQHAQHAHHHQLLQHQQMLLQQHQQAHPHQFLSQQQQQFLLQQQQQHMLQQTFGNSRAAFAMPPLSVDRASDGAQSKTSGATASTPNRSTNGHLQGKSGASAVVGSTAALQQQLLMVQQRDGSLSSSSSSSSSSSANLGQAQPSSQGSGARGNKRAHSSSSSGGGGAQDDSSADVANHPSLQNVDANSRLILDEFTRAGLLQAGASAFNPPMSFPTEMPRGQRRRGPKPKAAPGMQKSCGIRIDELRAQRICRVLGVDRVLKTDVASLIDFSLDRLEGHPLYVRQNGISGVETESLPLPESKILPAVSMQESINVHSQTAIIWKRHSYHHAERVAKELRQTKYKRQYKHAKRKREMRLAKADQDASQADSEDRSGDLE